jgi:hypothetical protein
MDFARGVGLLPRQRGLPRLSHHMSDLERLLVPGCTEMPSCLCGKEMRIDRTYSDPRNTDAHIRIYKCLACGHEMRLTVWGSDEMPEVA